MKQDLIKDVVQGMLPYLNNAQGEKLQEILKYSLAKYEVTENQNKENNSEQNFVELFLSAKRIEGCSEKSLKYYKATIEAMLDELQKEVKHIVTDDIRVCFLNVCTGLDFMYASYRTFQYVILILKPRKETG